MSFWPNDIFVEVKSSPREIMKRAGDELRSGTKVLSVTIRESVFPDRVVLGFLVKNEIHSLEWNVFEASHRPKQSYPVVIDPPVSDLPQFLVRERRIRQPSIHAIASMFASGISETIVRNEWVCATPAEFTEKLKEILASDYVKANIVSLMSPTSLDEFSEVVSESAEYRSSKDDFDDEADETFPGKD